MGEELKGGVRGDSDQTSEVSALIETAVEVRMPNDPIGEAKRFLMERYELSEGDALDFLVELSYEMGITVNDVAVHLIHTAGN